ncbi:TetR/AcrR family transcriptional regulator [Propioniciclava tarda]|uniref:TetR/AcrR family transcriptional regulator n=1 Tax=Propioniciclava tarda TaxID=433330 RepID=A0A4Q9KQA5_PROTD|nr:TetR/AcrR family transcriptional regulator [Propioniciclava tarda]TBT96240.1 TetR/AcrR family transcriptional regulator [Propioniciclava tarda]SMO34147.1 transcriptional regulator, TetR family [Propioniciclava tarda]
MPDLIERRTSAQGRPKRADVRADIMRSAIASFEVNGYGGTSLDAVAASAGYTKGAVYSNFGGKPELFGAACRETLLATSTSLLDAVRPTLEAAGDRAALIGPLALAVSTVTLDGPLRWQLLLDEFRAVALRDPGVGQVYAELSRARVDDLVALFETHPYLAKLPHERLRLAVVVLLNLVNALALEHAAAPGTLDRASIETVLCTFLHAVLP